MLKILYFICVVNALLVYSLISCDSTEEAPSSQETGRMTLNDAVKTCNKTIVIPLAWLHEFNNSGSFPDEFKTEPKCFLNCIFLELGIIPKESATKLTPPFDLEQADYYFSNLRSVRLDDMPKIVESCQKLADEDDEKEKLCEYSYSFGKCIAEELSRRFRTNIIAEI